MGEERGGEWGGGMRDNGKGRRRREGRKTEVALTRDRCIRHRLFSWRFSQIPCTSVTDLAYTGRRAEDFVEIANPLDEEKGLSEADGPLLPRDEACVFCVTGTRALVW